MSGVAEEQGAQAQANGQEVNKKDTLSGTTKNPGHAMVQMVMTGLVIVVD